MKRILFLVSVIAATVMCAIPAFAAITEASSENNVTKYQVSLTGLEAETNYVLFVFKTELTTVPSEDPAMPDPWTNMDNIKYMKQLKSDTSGNILFDTVVIDDSSTVYTLFLTGGNSPLYVGAIAPKLGGGGTTVSGIVKSWNNTDDAVIRLYPSTMTDAQIKTDIKSASPSQGVAAVKGAVVANADGKHYDQTFTLASVSSGEYKIAVYKPGGYVVKISTVNTSSPNAGTLSLELIGDLNVDGIVNAVDTATMLRHVANWTGYTTLACSDEAADINGDGNINALDTSILSRITANWAGYSDYLK